MLFALCRAQPTGKATTRIEGFLEFFGGTMERLSAALLALIVAIAIVGCSGVVSGNPRVPQPGRSPLLISTSSLPGGQVQASYSATLAATGGTQPYGWSVVAGSLPPGLALGASTGVIAGVPSASGQYSFTVQVTDLGLSPQSARQTFTISIADQSGIVTVTVTPNPAACSIGGTVQFKAVDQLGNDITNTSQWASSVPAVATIGTSTGLANCLTSGQIIITATH